MTVAELIDALQKMPKDAEVWTNGEWIDPLHADEVCVVQTKGGNFYGDGPSADSYVRLG